MSHRGLLRTHGRSRQLLQTGRRIRHLASYSAHAPSDDEHQADDLPSVDKQLVITVPVPTDLAVDRFRPAWLPCNYRAIRHGTCRSRAVCQSEPSGGHKAHTRDPRQPSKLGAARGAQLERAGLEAQDALASGGRPVGWILDPVSKAATGKRFISVARYQVAVCVGDRLPADRGDVPSHVPPIRSVGSDDELPHLL